MPGEGGANIERTNRWSLPRQGGQTGAVGIFHQIKSWFRVQLTVIVLACISLGFFVGINVFAGRGGKQDWLVEHSLQAFGTAVLAWSYALIYLVVTGLFGMIYLLVRERARNLKPVMMAAGLIIYMAFAATSIMPISLILYELQAANPGPTVIFFSSLFFVNGLFLYLGINFMAQIKEEMSKSYVISAEFKSSSRVKFLKEHLVYFLLNNFAPAYYFIMTFTLVPELIEGGAGTDTWFHKIFGTSIVYDLFFTVLGSGFSEPVFWSQFFAFLFFVLLIRLVLIDSFVRIWEIRHGIDRS